MTQFILKTKYILIYSVLLFLTMDNVLAQDSSPPEQQNSGYFASIHYGTQMSGIKDEDFISTNYSPLYNITAGKWFNRQIAIQVGYKGLFYYTIADDIKHYYNFLYAEAVINFNNFIDSDRINRKWSILLNGGPGYFYNHVYGRASLHINLGIQNTFQLTPDL